MLTVLIVIGTIITAFVILFFMAKRKMNNVPLVKDHSKILTLTDANFQQMTKNKLVLVDFWAAWCAPCRMMAPVLNELAGELPGKAQIGKVDIEKFQSLAGQFKVRSIPTLLLLKNGKEINRFVGIKSKDFLMKEIAKIG